MGGELADCNPGTRKSMESPTVSGVLAATSARALCCRVTMLRLSTRDQSLVRLTACGSAHLSLMPVRYVGSCSLARLSFLATLRLWAGQRRPAPVARWVREGEQRTESALTDRRERIRTPDPLRANSIGGMPSSVPECFRVPSCLPSSPWPVRGDSPSSVQFRWARLQDICSRLGPASQIAV